jgi:hypothetical protein
MALGDTSKNLLVAPSAQQVCACSHIPGSKRVERPFAVIVQI